ncbi:MULTISPECIES: NAD(P)-binding domain-containing protein [unclassified Streptomyces]|uniref:NAD(P)-dependent oxidoreductase n=1 Tax=unclassified Streptomyces TaxID=2593676 RepID=UPI00081DCA1E|nr:MULTISPECIES: NAD(P)-binding domain-containing protein [unclassified Streptomyces]OSC76003.1 dehydrogenase [Streptomyces sp. BF-3]PVC81203.1 NAD(P)-dependent oxidoreductase [Streptomyces sp. CS131]UCA52864.1 NAD(P)-binding domain-containing protein [Streptomyces sp. WA6-1-16]SCF68463.1 3-hydroxyisobutyrate dehydrogenase [Streptomyces sp. Cmuel-A718b]
MTQAHTTTEPAPASTPVTVLGLGDMGRSLARAFLAAGHPTTVWNRSPEKGEDVVALGAVRAASADEAVRASGLVVVCLVDYDASDAVLEPLAEALKGRVLVNLTSDTPARSRQTAAWAAKHSLSYLDGAIMVPVDVVGSAEALVFHSGDRAAFSAHEDTLKALGEPATYLGEDHGLAAAYDMAMLDFFYGAMGGLVHAFALARAEGIEPASLAPYLTTITGILPPIVEYTAEEAGSGAYPANGANLGMMAASVDHILHTAKDRGLDVAQLAGLKSLTDRAIVQGRGPGSWSSLVEVIAADR